jgi:hypothetical protein
VVSGTNQLHSYQFSQQRVVAALVMRRTDPEYVPLRRGIAAFWTGLVIAALVMAAFGIYGLVMKTENTGQKDAPQSLRRPPPAAADQFAQTALAQPFAGLS